jgi:hypothetical protein
MRPTRKILFGTLLLGVSLVWVPAGQCAHWSVGIGLGVPAYGGWYPGWGYYTSNRFRPRPRRRPRPIRP